MPVSAARLAAYEILLRVEQEDAYASELLHSDRYSRLSHVDHGLTTELVMGVLRWRSLLDRWISECSSQALRKIDIEILTSLRLGAYQLRFLERVPARAAVHEAVELVKHARKRSAVPFANAVLRKLAEGGPKCAADGIRIAGQPAELAERSAHPLWLVERWSEQFGLDTARQICEYDQRAPEMAVRLNPGVPADFQPQGIKWNPGRLLASARRIESGEIEADTALAGGISIQDEGSQLVALLAGRGTNILDCCAAPGGKTRILAARNPGALVTAVELHPHRARPLQKLVLAANVKVITGDICSFQSDTSFDCVLADVPCSGTGTLARNPEIKWRLEPDHLGELQARQLAILRAGMKLVSQGGKIVYSTCSLEREENNDVVERALASDSSFAVLDCRVELERLRAEGELVWENLDSLMSGLYLRTLPGVHPCDGFFAAILRKS